MQEKQRAIQMRQKRAAGTLRPALNRQRDTIVSRLNAEAKMPGLVIGKTRDPDETQYTVIIMGMPRGGTTMVAGVAQRLGLNIGQRIGHNLEDPDFSKTTQSHKLRAMRDRNATMDVWGWKFPAAARYLSELLPHVRNPRIVVVWRDPFTAAMRQIEATYATESRDAEKTKKALEDVQAMVNRQLKNLTVLEAADCPVYLVSYEKAVRHPEKFVRQLADFIGLTPPEDISEIVGFMAPESYKPVS